MELLQRVLLIGLVFFLTPNFIHGQREKCKYQNTCEECLGDDLDCAWCIDKMYEFPDRCLTREQLLEKGCAEGNILENEPEMITMVDNPIKDYETVGDRAVQVRPQKIYLKLVKSHPERIKLVYRPATNNPLDLYVLMDLTWTMRDDKETLVKLGTELAGALRNLTVNYRLGFGSYADKPAWPMMKPQLQSNPCASEFDVCEPIFAFRHHLPLTENIGSFVAAVNSSRVTGNLDNLEGGLDALMQVLVCPTEIGWNEDARKIVILVTDGLMHFAGDGLLAGVTQRNDKRCHLSASGEYLASLEYDYPSLEEIYRELLLRKVNVIFAVTGPVMNEYRALSNQMREVSTVDFLQTDSSNILELIERSYVTLIKRAQFDDDSPDFIKVEYETDCGGQFKELRKRSYCNNITTGSSVEFFVTFTLTDFPPDGIYTYKIRVGESSINEFMDVEVEIQKPCPCFEKVDQNDEYRRFHCNDNGHLNCGMCVCDEDWTGPYCNCANNPLNATTNQALSNLCRQPFEAPAELGDICSNRGECDCGTCYCFEGFDGRYCECQECGSDCDPERAECFCGKCICKSGWSGDACNCKQSVEDCIVPNGDICANRGFCECGKCSCNPPYKGRFCEIDSENNNKLCAYFEPCVTCLINQKLGTGYCENLTEVCSNSNKEEPFAHVFVDEISDDIRCLARMENKHGIKCDHYFTYRKDQTHGSYLLIDVNDDKPYNYVAMTGGIVMVTFLLGLLLLCICMACVRYKDRREYARFENELKRHSNLMNSPLYVNPIIRYTVPREVNDPNPNPFL